MEDVELGIKVVVWIRGVGYLRREGVAGLEYFQKVQGEGDKEYEFLKKSRSCWRWLVGVVNYGGMDQDSVWSFGVSKEFGGVGDGR